MRKGRSASSLGTPGPPRERRRALAGTFLPKDPWAAAASAPRPWPGQVCARGEPAAGVSAFTARLVLFVCLPRAGSSLFTGESHPETQALFLSGLSQVEESIKPPDRGKGRHSGTQSENHHRPPGARQRPLQRRTARPGPARPCPRSGSAAASASCSCPPPGPPSGGKVSRFQEESSQTWAANRPFCADSKAECTSEGAHFAQNPSELRPPPCHPHLGFPRDGVSIRLPLLDKAV